MKAEPKTSTLTLDGVKISITGRGAKKQTQFLLPRTYSGADFDRWMQRNKKALRKIK